MWLRISQCRGRDRVKEVVGCKTLDALADAGCMSTILLSLLVSNYLVHHIGTPLDSKRN